MNRDLEEQLNEMGPAYRAVVNRLVGAYEEPQTAVPRRFRLTASACLLAASVVFLLGMTVFFLAGRPGGSETAPRVYTVRAGEGARAYLLARTKDPEAIREILRTQKPDGGWGSDFLTRQNAEALRLCKGEAARIAYKKALRNLRARGLL